MLVQKIKNRIKKSTAFGLMYYVIVLSWIKFLQIFVRPNQKQILFISYSGRQYSDSPKEAYLQLRKDPAFADYKFVWSFNNPDDFVNADVDHIVRANTPLYFYHLLKSKYWIANSTIDRLIPFSHPRNVYIQFWHGVPMKKLGLDEAGLSPLVRNWYKKVQFNYLFTYGGYDTEKMKRIFPRTKNYCQVGQLRKQTLEREVKRKKEKLKRQLGIKGHKPIMLYVPTFRGYETVQQTGCSEEFSAQLSDKFTVLYREHYFNHMRPSDDFIVADKMSLNKLMAVADFMITDYSSTLFDYATLHRPIYLFQPDVKEYETKRGLYISFEDLDLPVAHSEASLAEMLDDYENYDIGRVVRLADRYNPHDATVALAKLHEILVQ